MEMNYYSLQSNSKSTFKLNHLPPSFSDDFLPLNPDDFFVDGLLDFSTDTGLVENDHNSHDDFDTDNLKPSSVSPMKTSLPPETELCLPVDDVADLEWVSQFVDDSFSGEYFSTCSPVPAPAKLPETETETETVTLVAVNPSFKNMVHKKARSKRSRTGGRVWSSAPVTDSSGSCSSSSSSCTSKAVEEILGKPAPVKRQKKKREPAAAMAEPAQPRRCSHCFVQKTPQWRAGPLGTKTLCNACGVRFKSGRLLPEYRPACSPTFSSEVHSNNHRKVLEMRRKKEEEEAANDGGQSVPVQRS